VLSDACVACSAAPLHSTPVVGQCQVIMTQTLQRHDEMPVCKWVAAKLKYEIATMRDTSCYYCKAHKIE
jgi:hypothetical protein